MGNDKLYIFIFIYIVNAQKREISISNITLIGIYMVINRFTQLFDFMY